MPRINSSSFTSHNLISIYKQTALVHFYLFVYVYRATCMNVSERTTRAVVKFQKFYFWISCLCHCCWCFAHSFEKNMSFRWKNHHHLLTFGAVYISDNDIRLLSDERKLTAHFMLKTAPLSATHMPTWNRLNFALGLLRSSQISLTHSNI